MICKEKSKVGSTRLIIAIVGGILISKIIGNGP
jgi:fucose permease